MNRKKRKKSEPDRGFFDLPEHREKVFSILARRRLEWLETRNYSPQTVQSHRKHLSLLAAWFFERGLYEPSEITRPILERYQRHLYRYRKANGEPLSIGVQYQRLSTARSFFSWLTRSGHISANPASDLEFPRTGFRLPRDVLTEREVELVLLAADVSTPTGLRDRAIMETLYSTGIRRQELVDLRKYDLHAERGVLLVRAGKGDRDRWVPIGSRALEWIERYLLEGRAKPSPLLVDGEPLFLTEAGEALGPERLSAAVRGYIRAAGIGKTGSCHLFRHTMATLMLENGADTRYIQRMLGHASLQTTQIYTRVSIKKLREVHRMAHPASVMRKRERAEKQRPREEAG